jgi:hypothetical protein
MDRREKTSFGVVCVNAYISFFKLKSITRVTHGEKLFGVFTLA